MFQNGMSEEVQNYFVPEDPSKHPHVESARPYQADQGLFRNQFIDARAQMMGHQHFQQFPYIGNALQHKIPNGDFFDPRMQNRGQFQQHQQQPFFDPVLQQQQQQQQQQLAFFDQSLQAMQMEKLARQQELFLSQGHSLGIQQLSRPPQVGPTQVDSFAIRNVSMQPLPVYGYANDMNQQLVGKHLETFNATQAESEAIDNLNDLFGGVEKIFADDQVQESKSAIPGLGSLGASLINGCEAELFGDGGPNIFARGMQYAFKHPMETNRNSESLADRQLEHNYAQNVPSIPQYQAPPAHIQQQLPQQAMSFANDGHFKQYPVQQTLPRSDLQTNERWQNSNALTGNLHGNMQQNMMSRGTLQLFKDMDDNDNNVHGGFQTSQASFEQGAKPQANGLRDPKVDSQDAFRPTFSLGVQDSNHRPSSGGSQVRLSQSSDGGAWLKDAKYQSGEAANNRFQPDRLLLDSGKNQSQEVQRLISFGNSSPNVVNAAQRVGGMIGQVNEDGRVASHQNDQSFRSRAYLEQQKQQTQNIQDVQHVTRGSHANGSVGFGPVQGSTNYDASGDGKVADIQGGQSSGALLWNVSNARQNTPDSMLRGNSMEPSVSFKSSVPKPVFATTSVSFNDKPSSSEAALNKKNDDTYVENSSGGVTSCGTLPVMERGSFFPDKTDHKQSTNAFPVPDKPESDVADHRSSWPQLAQNHGSSMMSTFQDSRRQTFSKPEVRLSPLTDMRASVAAQRSESIFQNKDKDEMLAAKVFESSGPSKATAAVLTSTPSSSQATTQQERPQVAQSNLKRAGSDIRISRDFSGHATSLFGHAQHKPVESDSINDVVQLQHPTRTAPPAPPAPQVSQSPVPTTALQSSKVELQPKQDVKATLDEQPLPDVTKAPASEEKATGLKVAETTKDETKVVGNNAEALHAGQPPPEKSSSQPPAPATNQQLLGANAGANFAAMAQAKLAASQQLLQVPKDLQPADLQRLQNSQGPHVALHQQRVQAALQAYALSKGGFGPQVSEQSSGSSTVPGKSNNDPVQVQGAVGQTMKQQLLINSTFANSVLPKKRKTEEPPLIPWRTAISQLTGALPTIRPAELQWATDTNRLPEKENDEEYYAQDESYQFVARAKQRLKLTTQLMQHSLPSAPAVLMQSSSVEDRECATYVLARLSLGEACRITANEDGPQAKTNTIAATSELIVEGFKDRIKYLERVLQRLDSLPLTQEFVKNMQYLDKVCVTNRLMKCHQELFPVNFTSQRRIQQVQRAYPQPYVTIVPMPNTIPEEFQLFSL